jgi:hypothetical protein
MTGQGTAVATKQKGSFLERMLELAKTPEERERAFQLAERHAQNQLVQEITAELTVKSWGANASVALRTETVRWALEVGADPSTEVDILGGKPFLNANYWIRLVAVEPDFMRPEEIWVHHDERASPEENEKRKELRVQYAIPDAIAATVGLHRDQKERAAKNPPIPVKAAVLVFLHFKERGPFLGKKWSPTRANDDVGMDHPEASALTRAWRKAALAAVRRKPPFSKRLTNLIVQGRELDKVGGDLPALGNTPVAIETVEVQQIEGEKKVGVIERHEPSAICGTTGEHKRESCGYFKQTKEPPAS